MEICENFVKLYKHGIDKLSKNQRMDLLEAFKVRPLIDFRRASSGGLVMNDIVGLLAEEIEFDLFKEKLVETHSRSR